MISLITDVVAPAPDVPPVVLTDVAPPKYLPIDKRSVGVVVPSAFVRVAVETVRVVDGETRNEPARAPAAPRAAVDAVAAVVPLYVPAPPSTRTEPAANESDAAVQKTHSAAIIEIFSVLFFISLYPGLFYHISESAPSTFWLKFIPNTNRYGIIQNQPDLVFQVFSANIFTKYCCSRFPFAFLGRAVHAGNAIT